jgi:hypothetical protein
MKNIVSVFKMALLAFVLSIAGCTTVPQERVVIKTETKLITVPESLLTRCEVTTPPAKGSYLAMSAQKKEETLTNYGIDLLKDINLCNTQIKKIKEFQDKQIKSFQDIEVLNNGN